MLDLNSKPLVNTTVVFGQHITDGAIELDMYYNPFKIGKFDAKEHELKIPDYDVGIYAIGLAIRAGVKKIWLAGFDGYDDHNLNHSKTELLLEVREFAEKYNVEIRHITPSNYNVFPQQSLYTL